MFALAILGLLMEDSLHGYEIRKQLGVLLGMTGAISYGSLYPTLAKLHRQGLIATTLPAPDIETSHEPREKVFSTGSLTGDIAYGTRSPFARKSSTRLSTRKPKKVYTITEKGRDAFQEKLRESFRDHADDDRAFVAHLAFMGYANENEIETFYSERTYALNARLNTIPVSDNHSLKLWHDVERQYIHTQIAFLDELRHDMPTTKSHH